ncbi:MAG: universal stress protein [Dehalococcoidales bacterium]|nr:universal stress protein [Dehalococcoidales bacterium]
MLKKILIPLDGSALGELALVYMKEMAPAFDAEVHLVSVCERHDAEYRRMIQVYVEKIAEQTRNDFEKPGLPVAVKTVVLDGEPAGEIIGYAQQKKIDLIIIVSHGHSGIMPWTMGSTANKVVHNTRTPVLLVRASAAGSGKKPARLFGKILLPLDGSKIGEAALSYVNEIAQKLQGEVILLSVIESGQHVHTIGGRDYIRFTEQQVESMRSEANEYLAATSKKLSDKGIKVRSVMKDGNAAKGIIDFAKENDIRLIAMSSHGKSGMREWVFGSISNKVLQTGKVPILLVRSSE